MWLPEADTPVPDHGGALARAEARFGRPPEGWLDLSTGINPWPYPVPPLPAEVWQRLPDQDALDRLKAAAAAGYGAPDPAVVAVAPGSQALIQLLPRCRPAGRVAVVGLTYAEHARCWRRLGHAVAEVPDLDAAGEADVVVVTNPNNPDGRRIAPARLLALADRLAARGGLLVVDEAFADVAPELSLAGAAGRPGLCALRSFGKFYGLAGLRLGFALAPPALVAGIEAELGPWAVPGPALSVGAAALADSEWPALARRRLRAAAADLDRALTGCGLPVIGGTDLFRLVRVPDAARLYVRLARRGILTRPFAARPDWLRLGLPPDAHGLARLEAGLRDITAPGSR